MRALFLVLVLANLGFFAWAKWIDVRPGSPAGTATYANARAPTLKLASEASPARRDVAPNSGGGMEAPAADGEQASDIASEPTGDCISVGPFKGLTDATQALAALRAAGYAARQRLEEGDVWVGYWVSLPPAASRAQAEATIAMLADRGITDTYILPGGEQANRISLGVFSDRHRAERRRDEVSLLGLDAAISDRRQPGSVYWLDVDLTGAPQPFTTDLLQAEPGRILRIETRACRGSTDASSASPAAPPAASGESESPAPLAEPSDGPPDALGDQPTNPT